MKRLLCLLLALVLFPVVSLADDPDPIVGAWYIMLDYKDYQVPETAGKNYMLYIMIFEESGVLSGISGESLEGSGLIANGSSIGTWSKDGDKYVINMIGVGSNSAMFFGRNLLVQMLPTVWYSMQRMNLGSWYTDLVVVPQTNE